jgi:hypothetical protein
MVLASDGGAYSGGREQSKGDGKCEEVKWE